ncbi:ABC transporter ATP-binding protein [Oligoflexus tunisiensis]|uniref:ABC transporter ATP-binding protein n=1 Tax=Oligoflexus tunisiensis TaxID=708132 RepID=UPI00114C9D50|nr:ABC transporter ATP-binding protein [Oligoflexus tunisiensis]
MNPLIELRGITKTWPVTSGLFGARKRIHALEDINLDVQVGEILAVLGESGSGKSTLGRILARLETPDQGRYVLRGELQKGRARHQKDRWRFGSQVQMIFQDPFASLNPVHSVGYHVKRSLVLHGQKADKAGEILDSVGLRPGPGFLEKFPFELSGGQRQRVAIARALAVRPALLIADEPTSMLDVSIRMDILNLLKDLRAMHQLAILLITHDLPSAFYLSDRLVVMYAGQVVEAGPVAEIRQQPAHPYTQLLLKVATERIAKTVEKPRDAGMLTAQLRETRSCLFATRCPKVQDLCVKAGPALIRMGTREVRCHFPS